MVNVQVTSKNDSIISTIGRHPPRSGYINISVSFNSHCWCHCMSHSEKQREQQSELYAHLKEFESDLLEYRRTCSYRIIRALCNYPACYNSSILSGAALTSTWSPWENVKLAWWICYSFTILPSYRRRGLRRMLMKIGRVLSALSTW